MAETKPAKTTAKRKSPKAYPRKPLHANQKAQQIFLDAVAEGHSLEKSARAAGYTRRAFLNLREADPDFQQLFEDAYDAGTDQREDILDEVVWQGERVERYDREGNLVAVETRHDTRAMLQVLAARRPERWSQRQQQQIEVSGPKGEPIQVEGARVTGVREVLELARTFGIGLGEGVREGLSTGPARGALPAAEAVLPDPGDGQ